MADETIIATWGYKPDGDARIFDLAPGESLPEGWHTSPDVITDATFATAEALTARAAGRVYVPPAVTAVDEVPAAASPDTAMAEIDRLKGIIEAGFGENQTLYERLDAAEGELNAAAQDIIDLRAALADAGTAKDAALAKVDAIAAELTQARADLDAATTPAPGATSEKPADKPKGR